MHAQGSDSDDGEEGSHRWRNDIRSSAFPGLERLDRSSPAHIHACDSEMLLNCGCCYSRQAHALDVQLPRSPDDLVLDLVAANHDELMVSSSASALSRRDIREGSRAPRSDVLLLDAAEVCCSTASNSLLIFPLDLLRACLLFLLGIFGSSLLRRRSLRRLGFSLRLGSGLGRRVLVAIGLGTARLLARGRRRGSAFCGHGFLETVVALLAVVQDLSAVESSQKRQERYVRSFF